MELSRSGIHPAYIAATIMIIGMTMDLTETLPMLSEYIDFYSQSELVLVLASSVSMFIGAMYLFLAKHENLRKTLSVCAVVISIICFSDSYMMLVEYREMMEGDLYIFVRGTIMLALAIMLGGNAVTYIKRFSNGTKMIFFAALGMLILKILTYIIYLRNGATLTNIFWYEYNDLPMDLLLILMILMLRSDSVRVNTMAYDMEVAVMDMKNSLLAVGMSVDRSVVRKLTQMADGKLWCQRYSFVMNTFYDENYTMVVTRTADGTHVKIYAVNNRSAINSFRFDLRGVRTDTGDAETCDLVRFYGDNGLFVQMIVRDGLDLENMKLSKRTQKRFFSYEKGTRSYDRRVKRAAFMERVKRFVLGPGYQKKKIE